MIPYISQPHLALGPLDIHAFGVMVAAAVMLGVKILRKRAQAAGLNDRNVGQFVTWILVGGFVGAHLFDRLVYFPSQTWDDPMSLLRFWSGISSFGGFLGGTIGGLTFFRQRAEPGTAWSYVESFAYAFPFGWIFGRMGCFLAYDHPGNKTGFFLGEMYADGVIRHNLGLYEALYSIAIALVFLLLGRKRKPAGFFLAVFLILYAPFRFSVDFWRIIDVRYWGFTPGQYGCVALVGTGFFILSKRGFTRLRALTPPI